MKKQILTMFTGLFIGAIITGGASAYAAGILAERSSHRIFVDGQEVQMEAYGCGSLRRFIRCIDLLSIQFKGRMPVFGILSLLAHKDVI